MIIENPTLIIGLGGSGMKIGHALKKKLADDNVNNLWHNGRNPNGKVAFCFIENDQDEWRSHIKPFLGSKTNELFEESDIIKITNFNPYYYLNNLNEHPDLKRVYDDRVSLPRKSYTHGLGAQRQAGRVAIYAHFDEIHRKLRTIIDTFKEANQGQLRKDTISIYIITSICGGTGASIYFDVASILDDIAGVNVNKKAFFVTPNYYLTEKEYKGKNRHDPLYVRMQCTGWALMKEFEFFLKQQNNDDHSVLAKYSVKASNFKDKIAQDYEFSPASNAFLFDEELSIDKPMPHGNSFFKNISNIIFYSIISESNNKYKSEVEVNDNFTKVSKDNPITHSTVTNKTITYPRELFTEHFSAHYRYDVFKYRLFNTDFQVEDTASKKGVCSFANQFVDKCFTSDDNLVFRDLIADFQDSLNNHSIQYLLKLDSARFFNNDKLRNEEEINSIVSQTNSHLSLALRNLGEIYNRFFIEIQNFDRKKEASAFDGDKIIDDELKKSLQTTLNEYGLYAILGIDQGENEKKGFFDLLREKLSDLYLNLEQIRLEQENNGTKQINNITSAQENLLDVAKSGFLTIKKKTKRLPDIQQFIDAVKQRLTNEIEESITKLKMKLLFQLTVGSNNLITGKSFFKETIDSSLIDTYEKSFETLVSANKDNSLLRLFKGDSKTDTSIKTYFEKELPRIFEQSDDDLFTFHIPAKLSTYVDRDEYDNWKKESDLWEKYSNNIKPDLNQLENIDINYFLDLSTCNDFPKKSQILLDSIDLRLNNIIEQTEDVNQFLNQKLETAYDNTASDRKEELNRIINEPVYMISTKGGVSSGISFCNVHTDLQSFALNYLPVDQDKIVINQDMPDDRIVIISILNNVKFEDLKNGDLLKNAYQNRDKSTIRPHIYPAWNDLDTLEGYDPYIYIDRQTDRPIKLDYFDAFIICNFLDTLNHNDMLGFMFPEDERVMSINSITKKPPIFYNDTQEQYVASKKFKFEVYGNATKLTVSNKSEDLINLTINKRSINYSDMLIRLMSVDDFADKFGDFLNTLLSDNMLQQLQNVVHQNKKVIYDSLYVNYESQREIAQARKDTSELSSENEQYSNDYMKRLLDIIRKLFKINLAQ